VTPTLGVPAQPTPLRRRPAPRTHFLLARLLGPREGHRHEHRHRRHHPSRVVRRPAQRCRSTPPGCATSHHTFTAGVAVTGKTLATSPSPSAPPSSPARGWSARCSPGRAMAPASAMRYRSTRAPRRSRRVRPSPRTRAGSLPSGAGIPTRSPTPRSSSPSGPAWGCRPADGSSRSPPKPNDQRQ
jgi:hypothetical protein